MDKISFNPVIMGCPLHCHLPTISFFLKNILRKFADILFHKTKIPTKRNERITNIIVMTNDIFIDVQPVSKRFCKDLKRSMRYGFKPLMSKLTC